MAARVYANFVSTKLTAQLLTGGTTANVTAGGGALFAGANGSDWIIGTLRHMSGFKDVAHEIVKITDRTVDALTIERAQEGTTALQFEIGDMLDLDFTATSLGDAVNAGSDFPLRDPGNTRVDGTDYDLGYRIRESATGDARISVFQVTAAGTTGTAVPLRVPGTTTDGTVDWTWLGFLSNDLANPTAYVNGDGDAISGPIAVVVGSGNAAASAAATAADGNAESTATATTTGTGNTADVSHTATSSAGDANAKATATATTGNADVQRLASSIGGGADASNSAEVTGDGTARAVSSALVSVPTGSSATSGFTSTAGANSVGIQAVATASGFKLTITGGPLPGAPGATGDLYVVAGALMVSP